MTTGPEPVDAVGEATRLLDAGQVDAAQQVIATVLVDRPGHLLARLVSRRLQALADGRTKVELEALLTRDPKRMSFDTVTVIHEEVERSVPVSAAFVHARANLAHLDGGELRMRLAETLERLGELERALQEAQHVQAPPEDLLIDLVALKARLWKARGLPDLALSELGTLTIPLLVREGRGDLLVWWARVAEDVGEGVRALRLAREAARLDPAVVDPHWLDRLSRFERTLVEGATESVAPPRGVVLPGVPRDLTPGNLLGGVCLIRAVLGQGGAGVVLEVMHQGRGRVEALKVLTDRAGAGVSARERMVSESRLLASLDHPHVVKVYELLELDGWLGLAMERLSGVTLGERLQSVGRLPMADVMTVARGLARALRYVHGSAIVHQDIKPGNVMLCESGAIKLMDFGLATEMALAAGGARDALLGTLHYLSPEQINGLGVGPGADIYAFGAVLFEMLCGQPPFDSPSAHNLMFMHLTRPPPPLRSMRSDAPSELEVLVAQCLEKAPEKRPSGFTEILVRLGERPGGRGR